MVADATSQELQLQGPGCQAPASAKLTLVLHGADGEHLGHEAVELVKAAPGAGGREPLEDVPAGGAVHGAQAGRLPPWRKLDRKMLRQNRAGPRRPAVPLESTHPRVL